MPLPPCAADGRQCMGWRVGGGLLVIVDYRLVHWLPGKPTKEQAPHRPLISYGNRNVLA